MYLETEKKMAVAIGQAYARSWTAARSSIENLDLSKLYSPSIVWIDHGWYHTKIGLPAVTELYQRLLNATEQWKLHFSMSSREGLIAMVTI
jgi:hypothetical protein